MRFDSYIKQRRSAAVIIFMLCSILLMNAICNGDGNMDKKGKEELEKEYESQRNNMVKNQIEARGITDKLVLDAMRKVPRHRFIPENQRKYAYNDGPLPIGHGQTISQPYIVAIMTDLMNLKGGEKVLEVGAGCGYQAAVLAEIASEVFTIEIVPELCEMADSNLKELNYENVQVRCGDGYRGWPGGEPFDAIMVTAAPDHVPPALVEQLKVGGVLVLPVGDYYQDLVAITKTESGTTREKVIPVRFVPMTGEAEEN